jgi:hypothetical protein
MLLGTLAAAIPLLIHLFDRRMPRVVPFAALAFVLRSQRRTASRLKLRRLLLYALRTLIFLALPIALAQPQRERPAAASAPARGLAATAILVDASLAMRWSDGRALFARAKDTAHAALRDLSPQEPATIVTCDAAPSAVVPLTFDRRQLALALDGLRPGYLTADLNRCLDIALHALDESTLPARRLVVISAFTTTSLQLEGPPPRAHLPNGQLVQPSVVLRDIAADTELANRAVVELRAEAAPELGPQTWRFTATVRNFSSREARDVELKLAVDDAVVAKGFVDLTAGGTARKVLTHRFAQDGTFAVTATLAHDALPDDDARGLVVTVPRSAQVLVVDGAPSTQKYRDEAYFVESALASAGSPVRAAVRDADSPWTDALGTFDAVFLLNVPAPSPERARALDAFVSAGGGLFVSAGDRVDPDAWNAAVARLLPTRLRVVKAAPEPGIGLRAVATNHPILSPFTDKAREGLLGARFTRFVLFDAAEGRSSDSVEVLASLQDGAPLLMASRHGRGRVLVLASTVDRDWTDLPLTTAFLPLVQRSAAWLSGSIDDREAVAAQVGKPVTLPALDGQVAATARGPGGADLAMTAEGTAASVSPPLPEPGRYQALDGAGHALPRLSFIASLSPAASDTSRHSLRAVAEWAGTEEARDQTASGTSAPSTPAWTWIFAVVALAFFLEGVVLWE